MNEWCGVDHPHGPHQWVPGKYNQIDTWRQCPGSTGPSLPQQPKAEICDECGHLLRWSAVVGEANQK
jgi:hypothetical protein